ncbi:MAG: transcriptional regulator GcvA [Gammaproteobacteria bacterium]|nr:transcriptional regulator GcvA [Gammaproteobacteria bacterium]
MPRQLPPLTALRTFEAAGRLMSFTRAAEELSVTQAAISHQVKSLETYLDVKLFNRRPRRLSLTAEGASLLEVITHSLDAMNEAVAALRDSDGERKTLLTLRSPPSFAAKWLAPKLKSFRRMHPAIELRIRHSNEFVHFERDEVDVAVTYGDGNWPGVTAVPVLSLDFFPVCSPHYLKGEAPLDNPNNLRHYNLLHDATLDNWSAWLTLAGAMHVDATRGTILDDTNVLIQAAIDGQGVALGSTVFVASHLHSGALVKPFEIVLQPELAYHVVCPPAHLTRKPVAAFRDWILAESSR